MSYLPDSYKVRSGPGVSGVRFQQPNSTRRVAIAHEMGFVSPVLVLSCNKIGVQVSGFGTY